MAWKSARLLLTISLSATALLVAGIIYRFHTELAAVLLVVVLAIPVGRFAVRALANRKGGVGLLVSVAVLNLLLVVPELTLRLYEYRYEAGIQFGHPRPQYFEHLEPDEELFWKLPVANPRANSLGFPGDEVRVPKPQDTFRVVFLGDSCTAQGFPDLVERFLNRERASDEKAYESVTLALSGYSSHQGRVLAERYGASLEPDAAVVYYGWNDHWLAYGTIDEEKRVDPAALERGSLERGLDRLRLVHAVREVVDAWRGANEPLDQVRVPIDGYERNLRAIAAVFAERNVPRVFVTAPTSHYALGVPRYLMDLSYARDADTILSLHRGYNEIARKVARETGSLLLDLEAEHAERPDLRRIYLPDGIHFTDPGLEDVARRIARYLRRHVLATGGEEDR